MADKVPGDVANVRSAKLRKISAMKTRLFQEHHLDQEVEILFEHAKNGYWSGYTGSYIRVVAPSNEDLTNMTRRVKLQSIQGDEVLGELV